MEGIPEECLAVLPEEIVVMVLSKLPVKSLMRFKSVSKRWSALITDDNSYLIASHLHYHHHQSSTKQLVVLGWEIITPNPGNYYQDTLLLRDESTIENFDISYYTSDPSLSIHRFGNSVVGSCNGIVCVSLLKNCTRIVLLNPATKKLRYLPEPIGHGNNSLNHSYAMGFGYDYHNKDYKLVRIDRFLLDIKGVQVFTQSTNSWREVRYGLPSTFVYEWFPPVAINEAFYWLGWEQKTLKSCVLSFNFCDEEFLKLNTPPQENENESTSCSFKLANWRGSLVVLEGYNFWLLSNPEKSWTKLFTINLPYSIDRVRLFGVWRDQLLVYAMEDEALLLYEHPRISGKRSGEKLKLLRKLKKLGPRARYIFRAIDYVESLVPVHPTVFST